MIRYIDSTKMGKSNLGWLNSHFHFSFAQYYNQDNIKFGVLRVVNDDIVAPGTGFDTHPHRNMEIVSYVVNGCLTHADNMGNQSTLTRGQVQYMSAGTGVLHSEHNFGDEELRFLQIWILPDEDGHRPNYDDFRFDIAERQNRWLPIATKYGNQDSEAPVSLHADVNIYASILEPEKTLDFKVSEGRQAYLVMIEGKADINNMPLNMRDALEIVEEDIKVIPQETAHMLIIEMAKE